jgi:hypothetical protein
VGARSAAVIIAIVFSVLFSLLYLSSWALEINKERQYQVLASKRADLEVSRLRMPQNICFELDDDLLIVDQGKNPEDATRLARAIKDADTDAKSDQAMEEQLRPPKEYYERRGNLYTGEGLFFETAEPLVPLLKPHESKFNHTIVNKSMRGYFDDTHIYNCNFVFHGNSYGLSMRLYSLRYLDVYSGFIPIEILDYNNKSFGNNIGTAGNDEQSASSFSFHSPFVKRIVAPFNGTVVWTNHSEQPVTLQIRYKVNVDIQGRPSSGIAENETTIYPRESYDEGFNRYYHAVDNIFNFTIKEKPFIHGTIIVDHYSYFCSIDIQKIKSTYKQTEYQIKLPDYIPAGYNSTICLIAERGEVSIYLWNKTLSNDFGKPGGFADPKTNIENGAIRIDERFDKISYGDAYKPRNGTELALMTYHQMLNMSNPGGYPFTEEDDIEPKLIKIKSDLLAVGTRQINEAIERHAIEYNKARNGPELYVVSGWFRPSQLDFYYDQDGVAVGLVGNVPLEDLIDIAKSMR